MATTVISAVSGILVAVMPDYTSVLLIRLLQGVVSKGSWTAGYTMSKHRRPGARGFDGATESGSWEEWGGPTRVANVASAGGPRPAPRTHSQSPSLSRTVICSRSPLPGAGHPGDVRLAPSPPRHLFQIPSPGPTPPLSENPQPLHPDSPESAGTTYLFVAPAHVSCRPGI